MGAIKIAVRGTQNHSFTQPEFAQLYADSFGEPLPTFVKARAAS
jgi:hypothetical protein